MAVIVCMVLNQQCVTVARLLSPLQFPLGRMEYSVTSRTMCFFVSCHCGSLQGHSVTGFSLRGPVNVTHCCHPGKISSIVAENSSSEEKTSLASLCYIFYKGSAEQTCAHRGGMECWLTGLLESCRVGVWFLALLCLWSLCVPPVLYRFLLGTMVAFRSPKTRS